MQVSSMASDNVRTGTAVAGFLPYDPMSGAYSFTADSLRDQPGVITYTLSTHNKVRTIYVPMDPTWTAFASKGVTPGTAYPTLVVAIFNAIDGTNAHALNISYRVVYEYIPLPSETDLLIPTESPAGSSQQQDGLMSRLWNYVGGFSGLAHMAGEAGTFMSNPEAYMAKKGVSWAWDLVTGGKKKSSS